MKSHRMIGSLIIAASLIAVGCDDYDTAPTTTKPPASQTPPPTPPPSTVPPATTPPPITPDADNTSRNKGDTDPTPLNQGQSESDIRITADIRRAIMEDASMSTSAQNCKVITQNGVVTLRGPVDSQAEKDSIDAKARAVAGVTRVDNQLEIKKP